MSTTIDIVIVIQLFGYLAYLCTGILWYIRIFSTNFNKSNPQNPLGRKHAMKNY